MRKIHLIASAIIVFSLLASLSVNQYASALAILPILNPPTNLTANAVSSSKINLSWKAPSDLGSLVITGYKIERSSGGAFAVIVANTGSTATTFSNTGLQSSTTYTYRVSAINGIGTSSPSNTASATTSTSATAPSPPTGLAAT